MKLNSISWAFWKYHYYGGLGTSSLLNKKIPESNINTVYGVRNLNPILHILAQFKQFQCTKNKFFRA